MSEQNSQKYERFSVVSFVDQATHNIVEELRCRIPPHIAVMPAHVTVKGSFVEPVSLKAVQEHIEREVNKTNPDTVARNELFLSITGVVE